MPKSPAIHNVFAIPPTPPPHIDGVIYQSDLPIPARVRNRSFVYRLLDPLTHEVKYIGCSNNPRLRFQQHARKSMFPKTPVQKWWHELTSSSRSHIPVMEILGGPMTHDSAEKAERGWEQTHREAGCNLLNSARCGLGRGMGEGWVEKEAIKAVLQLSKKLGLREDYPTDQQFRDNGLGGLYVSIERKFGGNRAFAEKIGMKMRKKPHWEEEKAEQEILKLCHQINTGRYPSPRQFKEHKLWGAYQAVEKWPGGHHALAAKLGFEKRHENWNCTSIEADVLKLVNKLCLGDSFPTAQQMRENGYPGLYAAINEHYGSSYNLARDLDLKVVMHTCWSASEAEEEILLLVRKYRLGGHYPRHKYFTDSGLGGLYMVIRERLGGHDYFAAKLQLARTSRKSPSVR